jgi:tetratricopeptide (TPR) repeat protein
VTEVLFSPDGHILVAACGEGFSARDQAVRLWPVPQPVQGEADRLVLWSQEQTGLELDSYGADHALDAAAREACRKRLAEYGDPPPTAGDGGPEERLVRHRQLALGHLQNHRLAAARWHLDRALALRPGDWQARVLRCQVEVASGRLEQAGEEWARAFAQGPPDAVFDSFRLQAAVHDAQFQAQRRAPLEQSQAGYWQAVVWYYDHLLAARPQDGSFYERRGQAQVMLNHPAQAEADYEQARRLGPGRGFFTFWGTFHLLRRDWKKALADYSRSLEQGDDEGRIRQSDYGVVCLLAGDQARYRKGCADFVAHLAPEEWAWWMAEQGTLGPDALPDAEQLVDLAHTKMRDNLVATDDILGRALYRAGHLEASIQVLNRSVAAFGGNPSPTVWLFLAMAHHRLGHAGEAKQCLDKAAASLGRQPQEPPAGTMNPHEGWPDMSRERAYWQVLRQEAEHLDERDRQALTEFAQKIAVAPREPGLLVERGRFYANRGQWDRAAANFTRAVELRPQDAALWLARARFQVQAGRRQAAADDYTRAAELRPQDGSVRRDAGRAQAEAGHWERAAAELARALELQPDDAASHHDHALALLAAGDRPAYRQACARMLRRFRDTTAPEAARQVLFACVAAPPEAADAGSVLRLAGTFAPVLANEPRLLGAACYRGGHPEAARKLLARVYPEGRRGPDWLWMALASHAVGQDEEARKDLAGAVRWIKEANPPNPDALAVAVPRWSDWRERVLVRVLRQEAETALLNKPVAGK